ncbi:MAG: arginase family protein [Hyphomicrobiaceae bacterium]|nr:arginase family protein [Hyphomicrobiaceae bacterium]
MQTFLGVASVGLDAVQAGDVVVLGAPDATPYEAGKASHSQGAPTALRAATVRHAAWHGHHDFDGGDLLLPDGAGRVVDAGNLACDPANPELNRRMISSAVRSILEAGAVPLVLGGDDSVPIPVLSAFDGHGSVWIVQIDAHIDWRPERFGEPLGWSSPMRRASEMAWVEGIIQIGIRGVGSATPKDVADARSWGAHIVTAREVHRAGIDAALAALPANARVVVSLDFDALDPSVMPGVAALAPGGLTYWQVIEIFEGLAARSRLVGCCFVELMPERDPTGIAALTGARIIANAIAAVRSGHD